MAFSQSDADKIDAELTNPKEEVRHGDKSMRSRSVEELLAAKNVVDSEVAKATGRPITRQLRIISNSGW